MQNYSENTKRIAKNTLMLYGRMLFSMVVSLYTSRVILNALGVEDYGIYNAVGGFVTIFSIISSALSSAISRFLTFELGRCDFIRLKKSFSTSLFVLVALSILVIFVAETVGLWFLNNKMIIPADRLYAAQWVYQASVVSFVLGLVSVPYNALIISHERMGMFAYIGIIQVLLKLAVVLFVAYSSWAFDRLIIYSLLLVIVGLLMQSIYWIYCTRNFEESHLELSFDKQLWKEMSSFAGWNFVGCSAGVLKDQGVNILINMFLGPVVNAARGIAVTVNNTVGGFANNFMVALNPQITKTYASRDFEYCYSLVERGARFSFFILLTIALPLFLETDFVLALWLKDYPIHTVNFVRLILVLSMVDMLSNTLITLQLATGNIKTYQIVVGGILLLNLPLSYLCLWIELPPESTLIIAITLSAVAMIARLMLLKRMTGISVRNYFKNVLFRVFIVTVAACICPAIVYFCMSYGWGRVVIVWTMSLISSSLSIYYLGCSQEERNFVLSKVLAIRNKVYR